MFAAKLPGRNSIECSAITQSWLKLRRSPLPARGLIAPDQVPLTLRELLNLVEESSRIGRTCLELPVRGSTDGKYVSSSRPAERKLRFVGALGVRVSSLTGQESALKCLSIRIRITSLGISGFHNSSADFPEDPDFAVEPVRPGVNSRHRIYCPL